MDVNAALKLLAQTPDASLDVAELALGLARDEYPDLDVEAYLNELAGMAHEAQAYLRGDLEARVTGLCRYLFHEMGFRGNAQDYYDARNSYLNQVIDRRTGIPITLSLVAISVGTRAGLEVVGVGLPGHFVAKAVQGDQQVVFDPFHGGRLLAPEQCASLVEQVTGVPFEVTPESLAAVPAGPFVGRMLRNLKGVYQRQEDFPRLVRVLERLMQLTPGDPVVHRELGVGLLQTRQPGKAINHLEAYLAAMPLAADVDTVRKLLTRARSAVAKWN